MRLFPGILTRPYGWASDEPLTFAIMEPKVVNTKHHAVVHGLSRDFQDELARWLDRSMPQRTNVVNGVVVICPAI